MPVPPLGDILETGARIGIDQLVKHFSKKANARPLEIKAWLRSFFHEQNYNRVYDVAALSTIMSDAAVGVPGEPITRIEIETALAELHGEGFVRQEAFAMWGRSMPPTWR